MKRKVHVCFLVTEDWSFLSHRFELGLDLVARGYQVSIITNVSNHREKLESSNIRVINHSFYRGNLNPFLVVWSVLLLGWRLAFLRPDIIHAVALQPILYASLCCLFVRINKLVFAFGGMGYSFMTNTLKAKIIRSIYLPILRWSCRSPNVKIIVQNKGNYQLLLDQKICRESQIALIAGAGIDPDQYHFASQDVKEPQIVLSARLLKDKGVCEFVEAARKMKMSGIKARFLLVGDLDKRNPASLSIKELDDIRSQDIVEVLGWRNDLPRILSQTQIVCIPSYHEGFPKVMLEAAASGCAIAASDIEGCRSFVSHNQNGLLFEIKSADALKEQLLDLITSSTLRKELVQAAYNKLLKNHVNEIIFDQTVSIYNELL